jgi:hypothetical protein
MESLIEETSPEFQAQQTAPAPSASAGSVISFEKTDLMFWMMVAQTVLLAALLYVTYKNQ